MKSLTGVTVPVVVSACLAGCGDDKPTQSPGEASCSVNLSSMTLHTTYVVNDYGWTRECYRVGSGTVSLIITNTGTSNLSGTVVINQPDDGSIALTPTGANEDFTIPPSGSQTYTFMATAEELCSRPEGSSFNSLGSIDLMTPCEKTIPVTVQASSS